MADKLRPAAVLLIFRSLSDVPLRAPSYAHFESTAVPRVAPEAGARAELRRRGPEGGAGPGEGEGQSCLPCELPVAALFRRFRGALFLAPSSQIRNFSMRSS